MMQPLFAVSMALWLAGGASAYQDPPPVPPPAAAARPAAGAVPPPATPGPVPRPPADGNAAALLSQALTEPPPVDLDFDNTPIQEALKQVLGRAGTGMSYVLDADVPVETRITVRAKKIRVSTALDLIAQSAGVTWGLERHGNQLRIRLGTGVTSRLQSRFFPAGPLTRDPAAVVAPPTTGRYSARELPAVGSPANVYGQAMTRERLTFTCPHCKGQATMVRERQQPNCPKCSRVFQGDWRYCPADGTKRPSAPSDWRFCPLCGKGVEPAKADPNKGAR